MKTFLTLDLNQVDSQQREEMYAALGKLNYRKLPAVTTLFSKEWQDNHEIPAYVAGVKNDLASAASTAKVTKYDVTVIVSRNEPVAWKV